MNIVPANKIAAWLLIPATMVIVVSCEQTAGTGASGVSLSSLRIEQPADRAVFQRDDYNMAGVPVACAFSDGKTDTVEVRALDLKTRGIAKDWTAVAGGSRKGVFYGRLPLLAGWYCLEIRAQRAGAVVAVGVVEHVGVGEVFVTCGQSNSANYGQPPQRAQDDRVSSCDFQTGQWRKAHDPQPGAGGNGGSPWPKLGDLLAQELNMPVGFVCVGVGATGVSYWMPSGKGYGRLKTALQLAGVRGVRAVLWHQGESDSIAGTSAEDYACRLGQTIERSRRDAGWPVPWGVALVSFHPSEKATVVRQLAIVAGQKKVIAEVPGVFQGPVTDGFRERGFLCDGVHFNNRGLVAHAQGWFHAMKPVFQPSSTQFSEKQQ